MMENEDINNTEKEYVEVDEVTNSDELNELQSELNSTKEQLFRTRAEMENQRKRMLREIDNAGKFVLQDFITRMLPAKDSMEKGLDVSYMEDGVDAKTLFEGMTSTLRICNEAFTTAGVEEIDPLGEEFDPEFHEAMAIKQVDGKEPNIVLSVFQKGYLLNGRLIRPARVEVSAG